MEVTVDSEAIEKITAYTDGSMQPADLTAFEQELETNSELKTQLLLYQELQQTLGRSETEKKKEDELRQTLTGISKQYKTYTAKTVTMKDYKFWLSVAAGFIILFVSYFLLNDKPDTNALYAEYAVHYPLSVSRGGDDSIPETQKQLLQNAVSSFNNKNYAKALESLNPLLAIDSADSELLLASGICNLETGNFNQAMKMFSSIESKSNVFSARAKWYMALTMLAEKNTETCRKILLTISPDADTYKQAQELLEKLNE